IEEPPDPPRGAASPGLAPQPAVRRQDPRSPGRQEVGVERRERQPLIVHDVGVGRAAEAEHVAEVLGPLHRAAPLRAEQRGRVPAGGGHEIIVLDNASADGSAEALRAQADVRLITRDRRAGLAENNSILLREARGTFCLLLNEDSEIADGAVEALLEALRSD